MRSLPAETGVATAVSFARDLATHGENVALITMDGNIAYRELAARVAAVGERLAGGRRLIMLVAAHTAESIIAYLAALAGGHAVLLVPGDKPGTIESLIAKYNPDIVISGVGAEMVIDERRAASEHELHPDLALLLATSGSTGSAKLVRLSRENLDANAEAIATYLAISSGDRAATTLPMSYCYGLSVINSYLLRGAALIVTDCSVADAQFWDLFRESRGTSFAGVPYTFDLLDRVGFESMQLPHLRYVTQAGGRLAPDRVRRYASLGQDRGWDLFVMYGQTEATARMAYLPPDLAPEHPHCIGVPIPGGSFRLEPLTEWADADAGELVYSGPNVMLGYAEEPSDLRLGRTQQELYTGDIARRTSDGLYEIVGRRGRFIKLFGLRIDLQRVEESLAQRGLSGCCVGDDTELVIAVAEESTRASGNSGMGGRHRVDVADHCAERVQKLVAGECGIPARVVRVCVLADLPRLANGKPDYEAIRRLTASKRPSAPAVPAQAAPVAGARRPKDRLDLRILFAEVLGARDVSEESTFVSLGGDSLSYVEMSVRLEQELGHLPNAWHTTPIRELRPADPRPRKWQRSLDTSVFLRAAAIVLVVVHHDSLFNVPGGAHILLGVAGYNFARFHLTAAERRDRARGLAASISRIVIASVAWIGFAVIVSDAYSWPNVLLVNYLFGRVPGDDEWDFWFIETLVYILLALLAVIAVPLADRTERRFPFALPLALMSLGLLVRFALHVDPQDIFVRVTPITVVWLFALGWLTAKATTRLQRLLVTATIFVTVFGWFGDVQREATVAGGLILLVWVSAIPSTRLLNRVLGIIAASSLYIYLTHWQIFTRLDDYSLLLAAVVSLGAGILYAEAFTRLVPRLTGALRRARTAGFLYAPRHR